MGAAWERLAMFESAFIQIFALSDHEPGQIKCLVSLLHTNVLGANLTVYIFSNLRPFLSVSLSFSTPSFRTPEVFVRLGQIGLYHNSVNFNTPF